MLNGIPIAIRTIVFAFVCTGLEEPVMGVFPQGNIPSVARLQWREFGETWPLVRQLVLLAYFGSRSVDRRENSRLYRSSKI